MGMTVYSLLWVMQDFVHQPQNRLFSKEGSQTNKYGRDIPPKSLALLVKVNTLTQRQWVFIRALLGILIFWCSGARVSEPGSYIEKPTPKRRRRALGHLFLRKIAIIQGPNIQNRVPFRALVAKTGCLINYSVPELYTRALRNTIKLIYSGFYFSSAQWHVSEGGAADTVQQHLGQTGSGKPQNR